MIAVRGGHGRGPRGPAVGRGAARDPRLRARARTRSTSRSRCARPGHEDELAVGFLRTEGLIDDATEIAGITRGDPATHAQPDDEVTVHLARPFDASRVAERHFVATASCGICGKASLDEVEVRCDPIPPGPVVDAGDRCSPSRTALREAQAVFEATGGLHAAGLFDADGRAARLREDVGRHNALDKLVGSQLLAGRAAAARPDRAGLRPGELRARAEGGGRGRPDPRRGLRAVATSRSSRRAPRR